MPLTDVTVKNAKPQVKAVKIFDERGLYLEDPGRIANSDTAQLSAEAKGCYPTLPMVRAESPHK